MENYKRQISESLIIDPFVSKAKLSAARKAISDYKKANGNIIVLLNLMQHYLECGEHMIKTMDITAESFMVVWRHV